MQAIASQNAPHFEHANTPFIELAGTSGRYYGWRLNPTFSNSHARRIHLTNMNTQAVYYYRLLLMWRHVASGVIITIINILPDHAIVYVIFTKIDYKPAINCITKFLIISLLWLPATPLRHLQRKITSTRINLNKGYCKSQYSICVNNITLS